MMERGPRVYPHSRAYESSISTPQQRILSALCRQSLHFSPLPSGSGLTGRGLGLATVKENYNALRDLWLQESS